MEILTTILQVLILVTLWVAGLFLKDAPSLFRTLKLEKTRGNTEKDIQRESFFRQIKGDELAKTLNYWTNVVLDMNSFISKVNSKKGAQDIIAMQKNVFMYGSEKTVIILSEMMQYFYAREEDSEGYRAMTFVAFLICSLKYDFTGYEIDPITILKIKITDIDINKLAKEKKYVEKILSKYNI